MDKKIHESRLANADLSAKQYYCVTLTSDKAAVGTSAGEAIFGILQNEPEADETADICIFGVCKARFGGTVAIGSLLTPDADGELVATTSGTDKICGYSLQAAADNQVGWVFLSGPVSKQSKVYQTHSFYFDMAEIADGDLVTAFTPGYAGTIEKVYWVQETAVTTASKASSLNVEIGTTDTTGGVVALTSAACTPLGVVVAGSAITAANTFAATDTISVEAASTTTFIEGAGTFFILTSQTL